MGDLLLFTPTKESHFEKLKDLLKALCKNGLKISPKKCQLFKTELQYMGNIIFIGNRRVHVKPIRSRLEAIQKLKPPMTAKGCRSFAGMVNFVSIFCPELQKLLKPIYDLTKKGRHFIRGAEKQMTFEEIKSRLQKLPVLSMPDKKGRIRYILTPVNMPLLVHYTKLRMVDPDSLLMQVKECLKWQRTIPLHNWKCVVWLSILLVLHIF